MRNIKLIIEYDGTRYQGWQQPGKDDSPNTILGRITSVLKKMTMEELTIYSGLRTETGVHAFCQTINFKTNGNFSADSFKHYLNKYLPMDIAVVDACEVPERFHASLSAKSRTYLYQLVPGDVPSVFQRKYSWHSFLPHGCRPDSLSGSPSSLADAMTMPAFPMERPKNPLFGPSFPST